MNPEPSQVRLEPWDLIHNHLKELGDTMTTREEFVEGSLELLEAYSTMEPSKIGDVVTGAYPGRDEVFGTIGKILENEDCDEFIVNWEDGAVTQETLFEIVTLANYASLTGRYYDPEAIRDKVERAHEAHEANK